MLNSQKKSRTTAYLYDRNYMYFKKHENKNIHKNIHYEKYHNKMRCPNQNISVLTLKD